MNYDKVEYMPVIWRWFTRGPRKPVVKRLVIIDGPTRTAINDTQRRLESGTKTTLDFVTKDGDIYTVELRTPVHDRPGDALTFEGRIKQRQHGRHLSCAWWYASGVYRTHTHTGTLTIRERTD